MPDITALIFDFDGVILDTETPEFIIWQEIFVAHGVVLERSVWNQFIGAASGTFDVYSHLAELSGRDIDRVAMRAEMRGRYLAQIDANPVMPGILDYISGAKSLGLKVGLATSSDNAWVEGHLSSRGLLGYFDAITTKEDVTNAKPDPEIYIKAAARLGTAPENAIAIEDSLNGVTAAKRAGLNCVVVPNPMTASMDFEHADLRLDALSDMSLQAMLDRFSQAG